MAGLIEAFCVEALPKTSIGFLLGLTEEFQLDVAEVKKADKSYLLKVVLRHLTSAAVEESADNGAAIFLKLYQELGEELAASDIHIKGEQGESSGAGGQNVSETLSYHKLRQFKINGIIGDPGQKNCLSFSSLCYQISQGESQGYSIRDIYAGVIRAIEAGNPFRDVLELETEDFSKEAFMKSLRSHFKERNPNEIFNELRMCSQKPNESAHKFACRCVALKRKVQNMAKTGNLPMDEENLSSTFFRTIYTGLRQNNIRNELRATLTEAVATDQDLLMEISLASSTEEERLKKLNGGKTVDISKITCDSDSDDSMEVQSSSSNSSFSSNTAQTNNNIDNQSSRKKNKQKKKVSPQSNNQNTATHSDGFSPVDIGKLTAAFDKMSASNAQLVAEVNILKKMSANNTAKTPTSSFGTPATDPTLRQNTVTGNAGQANGISLNPTAPTFYQNIGNRQPAGSNPRNTGRFVHRCQNCLVTNSPYCSHCFKCGSGAHKIKDCPEN